MTANPAMTDSVTLKIGDTVSIPDVGERQTTFIREIRPGSFQLVLDQKFPTRMELDVVTH